MNGISSKNLLVVNYRTIYNILDPYVPQVTVCHRPSMYTTWGRNNGKKINQTNNKNDPNNHTNESRC